MTKHSLNFPQNKSFIALISYDKPEENIICAIEDMAKFGIKFELNKTGKPAPNYELHKFPISFEEYKSKFDHVISEQKNGNSYLLNLCFKTKIQTNLSLEQIYEYSSAKAVIYKKDDFVCFSPEPFVFIEDGFIHTFPMKGTIDASLPNAKELLLNDAKELSEQAMMTDLMRNDLSMVATEVRVEKFRYISKVKNLYQTSSHISGKLNPGLSLSEIFSKILPAGSISGTPKIQTCNIIKECENEPRGFYTGVFIYFDGIICQSFVMIRFVKKQRDELYFFSGGGITAMSDAKKEYEELGNKVYFPF